MEIQENVSDSLRVKMTHFNECYEKAKQKLANHMPQTTVALANLTQNADFLAYQKLETASHR